MSEVSASSGSVEGRKFEKIQALSFDLDDTLWPLMPTVLHAEKAQWAWLSDHYPQHSAVFTRDRAAAIRERLLIERADSIANVSWMRQELLRRLAEEAGLSAASTEQMVAGAFAEFLVQRCAVGPFADALEVLPRLAERYKLIAITNGNADVFATELGPLFEFSLSPVDQPDDAPTAKPEAGIFRQALTRLGLEAEQVLHIGDSVEHDIAGAAAVGMPAVLMQHELIDGAANSAAYAAFGINQNAALPGGEHGAEAVITSLHELEALLAGRLCV